MKGGIMIEIKNDEGKLLHMVYKISDLEAAERDEIIEPNNFLQLAALNMPKGKTFEPHKHIWKDGEKKVIAQESWVVIKGKVEVSYFNELGYPIQKEVLEAGDVSITLHGGHTYTILEDALVYEYKTGPYTGQKNDKVFLKELDYSIL